MKRRSLERTVAAVAAALLAAAIPSFAEEPAAAGTKPRASAQSWDQQAGAALCVGPGIGRQLVTEEEWEAHRLEMRSLDPAQRERARAEWHEKMVQRAKEKGIELPATPCRRRGMGGGGMGRGRGMRRGGPPLAPTPPS